MTTTFNLRKDSRVKVHTRPSPLNHPVGQWQISLCWQTAQHSLPPVHTENKKVRTYRRLLLNQFNIPDNWLSHLLCHGRHVPDVTHDGPAGHHPQQITHHVILAAVPERISKLRVVLQITPTCNMDTLYKKGSRSITVFLSNVCMLHFKYSTRHITFMATG